MTTSILLLHLFLRADGKIQPPCNASQCKKQEHSRRYCQSLPDVRQGGNFICHLKDGMHFKTPLGQ
jgi:hypothetical protein